MAGGGSWPRSPEAVEEARLDQEMGIPADGSRPKGPRGVGVREVTRRTRVLESNNVAVSLVVMGTWPRMRGSPPALWERVGVPVCLEKRGAGGPQLPRNIALRLVTLAAIKVRLTRLGQWVVGWVRRWFGTGLVHLQRKN
jgi:hypothetical protein